VRTARGPGVRRPDDRRQQADDGGLEFVPVAPAEVRTDREGDGQYRDGAGGEQEVPTQSHGAGDDEGEPDQREADGRDEVERVDAGDGCQARLITRCRRPPR